jgi:hypothetical protein
MGVASARTNYAISKYFVKRFFSTIIQKLDVLCPGHSVTGRLVNGRFVTGRFVTGCYVTGHFLGVLQDRLCTYAENRKYGAGDALNEGDEGVGVAHH